MKSPKHPYSRRLIASFSVLVGLAIVLTTTGCEEEITPVERTDFAFSMYGALNPLEDVQAVRVFQIDDVLEQTRPESLDALVQSTDLETGEMIVWQDSIVRFPTGNFGHVFWAPFTPQYEHRYRIEVSRSDGATADVVTRVPPISTAEILPADLSTYYVLQPVLWRDAPNLIQIRVRYVTNAGNFEFDYNVAQDRFDGGQRVMIEFREDAQVIFATAFVAGISAVELAYMEMNVVVAEENWFPPGGVFDADVFSEPGTFSNVVGGFGFVGAGYPASVQWVPDDDLLEFVGFTLP